MKELLKQGIIKYRSQVNRDKRFGSYGRRIRSLLSTADKVRDCDLVLLLTPMIEVAWVDGRIGIAEQNAILKTADTFGLLDSEEPASTLMEHLTTRPSPRSIRKLWDGVFEFMKDMPAGKTAAISSMMLEQARYVAELGQHRIYGWWRGPSSGAEEKRQFAEVEARLTPARQDGQDSPAVSKRNGIEDHLRILPLVKVAWADGRITKRERQMIFDSLFQLDFEPTNDNIRETLEWLSLSPGEVFFNASLEKLRLGLEGLDPEERANEKYGLISQCTLIAEASGGNSKYEAGGVRICDEEITVVKQIARILNGAISRDASGGKRSAMEAN